MKLGILASAALLAWLPLASHSMAVNGQYTHLSGTQWQMDLTLVNDASVGAVSEFAVYFGDTLFANLSASATPAAWDAFVGLPDTGLHVPGYVDFYSDTSAVGTNQSLGGYSVTFNYLGSGAPGSLAYDILSPGGGSVLTSGTVTIVPLAGGTVPEPGAAALALTALALMGWEGTARRRRTVHNDKIAEVA